MNTPPRKDASFGTTLARQLLLPRVLGVWLCGLCVMVTLWERNGAPGAALTALMLANLFAWPAVAWWRTTRAERPMRAETLHLWLDAAYCGVWIAAMQGALVPCAALFMITSLTNAVMGGTRGMARSWLGHALGVAVGTLVWGANFQPASSNLAVLASLPLLLVYPLLMGCFMYRTNRRLNDKRRELRYLSEHDALSGVFNRRYFDQVLRQTFGQFQRHERALSLLVGDVDDFKRINDRDGHAAGDAVIRRFGEALAGNARTGDVVARLGGDEFVVLLFDTDAELAFHYARRVQAAMGDVSISFGVAMARAGLADHEQWLEQADRALYRSKAEDRGGVTLAGAATTRSAGAG